MFFWGDLDFKVIAICIKCILLVNSAHIKALELKIVYKSKHWWSMIHSMM